MSFQSMIIRKELIEKESKISKTNFISQVDTQENAQIVELTFRVEIEKVNEDTS